jgi:cysteine desulfurase
VSETPKRLYLDHNATSPLRPEAREAIVSALGQTGNPSSPHQEGRLARGIMDRARDQVARLCGAQSQDVIFTSGATEANVLALSPSLRVQGLGRDKSYGLDALAILATEHPCVLQGHRFLQDQVIILPVLASGLIDLDALQAVLDQQSALGRRLLVTVQAANSETGVIQPISEIAMLVHHHGGILHCDAVQLAGRLPLDQLTAGADSLALSAHKLGGPQGMGALVLRSGGLAVAEPVLRGGGQERGARAGTENVAGIAGFGAACEAALMSIAQDGQRLQLLRDRIEQHLKALDPDLVVHGSDAPRLPNTLAFSHGSVSAEMALMQLDLAGVALSSGSACSSGKVKSSHVLAAMGVSEAVAKRALRVSLGWTTTDADVIQFIERYEKTLAPKQTGKIKAA